MTARRRIETMEENRAKLVGAARKAFAATGYAAASMDDLTAEVGLTRGALYHAFGDKLGLLEAVVAEVDGEMVARAKRAAAEASDLWESLLAEATAHIEMALEPEIQRIILLDGPAFLGEPSEWPSAGACLASIKERLSALIAEGVVRPVDVDAATRLLSGAAFNSAMWVAAGKEPRARLPKAIEAFRTMAGGLLAKRAR